MASIAILAGVEPRPSARGANPHDISSAGTGAGTNARAQPHESYRTMHSSSSVHSLFGTEERRGQGGRDKAAGSLAEKGSGVRGAGADRAPAGSPKKSVRMSNKGAHVHHRKEEGWWNGDKSYYRQQVERLGFRFHQPDTNVPRRAPGQFRAAEGNNDLRNLLAAQPVSHMGPLSHGTGPHERARRSKRIDASRVNQSSWDPGDNLAETESTSAPATLPTPVDYVAEPAILNSDQVRAALVLNPGDQDVLPPSGGMDDHVGRKKLLGGMTSRQFDAKIVERENVLMRREEYGRARSQPSMESTLPMKWKSGSSWNPEGDESTFRTSNQVMNAGERIGHRNPFENARRLGRNRSVMRSQIVLG